MGVWKPSSDSQTHQIVLHSVWGLLCSLSMVYIHHVPVIVAAYLSMCVHLGISTLFITTPPKAEVASLPPRHDVTHYVVAMTAAIFQIAIACYYITSCSIADLMLQTLAVACIQILLHTIYLRTSNKSLIHHIPFSSLPYYSKNIFSNVKPRKGLFRSHSRGWSFWCSFVFLIRTFIVVKTEKDNKMAKDMNTVVFHMILGSISVALLTQTNLPILVLLYASVGAHVGLLVTTSDDVFSDPHLRLVLAMVAMEFCLAAYRVITFDSLGFLLIEGIILGIVQTLVHLAYLQTTPPGSKRNVALGEGRGRDKLVGRNQPASR